ncbi:MAG TPA: type II secretion system F family protein [Chthoniobacterales bacterium]
MATYTFRALAEHGGQETGRIESLDKAAAFRILRERKLRPLSLERLGAENPVDAPVRPGGRSWSRLSNAAVHSFTEELAQLLEAGLQLERALRVIEGRKEKTAIPGIAGFVRQQIREGKRFSSALRNTGGAFSDLYCNMVAAGEAAGALPSILRRQSQYLALISELRRRVVMALVYPSVVFSAGVVLLLIFMTFLLPQLTMLLSKTGQTLPLVTRILIGTSEFFGHYWWALLAAAALIVAGLRMWRKTPKGRKIWDRAILEAPLLGPILRIQFLAEFLQTLSTLVSNGITLLHGLTLMQQATRNVSLQALIGALADKVGEGAAFSRVLRQNAFFPPVLTDIIAVGEETGDLGGALERAAVRYDQEFTMRIQQLTTLIQPLTILVVALFVGLVAYSMITGILSSVSGLRLNQ